MSSLPPQLIPLDAPSLVEASAGTGKTYTITTYFVRALLERDLTPEQILVVTYTKAATAELRVRTRERILAAIGMLDEAPADGDLLHGVVTEALARLGRRETEERLRAALGQMDRAAISTIHGFCQRLLQDYPLLFGIDFDFEVSEDSASMFSELAIDFWATELYEKPDWFLRALQAEHVNSKHLAKLARFAMTPGTELLGPEKQEVDEQDVSDFLRLKRAAAEAWTAQRSEVAEILLTDKNLSRTYYKAKTIEDRWLPELDDFFAQTGFRIAPDFLGKLSEGGLQVKKGCEAPSNPFFGACAPLWEAHKRLASGFKYAVFAFEKRFIEFARQQARQRRDETAILTYDDLLSIVYAPFDPSASEAASFDRAKIAQTVSNAYRLALVDEFQDTDSLQYGIFRGIYGESSAVYVGDPKQAIYAFRGADIFSYLGAVSDVGDRVHTLQTNRRSDPALVRAVNTLFSLRKPPFILEGIEMHDALPHLEKSRTSFDPAMELLFLDQEQISGPIEAAVAPVVANEIALLLESEAEIDERRIEPGDIAVLCRSNAQTIAVTGALRALNIPVSLDGGSSVLSTEIASDLNAVLEAALMPGDAAVLRRALLTSLLGVSPYSLATMGDEDWSAWVSRFRDWNEAWHREGVVRFLEDLLGTSEAEERIARHPAARRILTDLLHIEELLLVGERERGRNPVALMQWFRRLNDESVSDRGLGSAELQQRPDAESGAVRVSTIHKSKGLEYGIVYCPFTWKGKAGDVAVKFHDEDRNIKVDLGSDELDAHKRIAAREADSESLRLLYVAVTRAKYRCTLFWGRTRSTWKGAALGYLLHGAEGLAKLDQDGMRVDVEAFAAKSSGAVGWRAPYEEQAAPRPQRAPGEVLARREQKRYFSHAARIASFTSLTGHDEKTPGPRASGLAIDAVPGLFADLPGGARTGLLLHSILENAKFQELDSEETRRLIEQQLRGSGFDAALAPAVQADLQMLGSTPLTSEAGAPRLIDIAQDRQLRELEFTLSVNRPKLADLAALLKEHGAPSAAPRYYERLAELSSQTLQRFLRGYIDLMFEWQGRWYVADYKSNTLPTYHPEAITDAVQREHYLLQAQLYTAAAHRFLRQRVPGYDPDTHWGGALFLFLRGMKGPQRSGASVFFDRQPAALLNAVDDWLGGER